MPNTTIIPQGLDNETDDTPKFFRNIDNENFEFTWDNKKYIVKSDERVSFPKYLVNYAAMHLARKMFKREAFKNAPGDPREKSNSAIKFVDANQEMELQKKMVVDNFQEEPKKDTVPMTEPIIEPTKQIEPEEIKLETPLKIEEEIKIPVECEICGFKAKSKVGLSSHKRFNHKSSV